MLRRYVFPMLFICFSNICFATPLWHCIALSTESAEWNQYGNTEQAARSVVERECVSNNDHKACTIVCFPPRVYWRCLSHDTVPIVKDSKLQPKQGAWYWTSFSRQVAINGARDACRHNSGFGGCYVNQDTCVSS